ncbi:Protein N-terminal amidase [Rhodotorula toruloides]|nr:Protein N-terminal amidase [Rhodotorula toruloides]
MDRPALRVACVQFDPVFKKKAQNQKKAEGLIAGIQPGALDLLILPEMAFTGAFEPPPPRRSPRLTDLAPQGIASRREKTLRPRKLGCYVIVGLPTVEPLPLKSPDSFTETASTPLPLDLYYNSLLVVSPAGTLVHSYNKTHLYGGLSNDAVDYLWATPGAGFSSVDLPFPPSSPFAQEGKTFRLAPAICMDLNPPRFDAPFDKFEFGEFAAKEKVDLVVVSMAWLDSEPPLEQAGGGEGETSKEEKDDWEETNQVMSYWVLRLNPLLGSGAAVICANRIGREGDTVFTGSSAAIELGDRPSVVAHASKRKEEVIFAQVRLPQRA